MASSRERVPAHTDPEVNQRIERETLCNVLFYSSHSEQIPKRLQELEKEWDIERAIEANAATLAFLGTALAAVHHRRWLALPALVTGFLLQHAIQGWCPPVPVLRRLGFRTAYEIEVERQALKALRGDYDRVSKGNEGAAGALEAARA